MNINLKFVAIYSVMMVKFECHIIYKGQRFEARIYCDSNSISILQLSMVSFHDDLEEMYGISIRFKI
jgi:hypothetical protein